MGQVEGDVDQEVLCPVSATISLVLIACFINKMHNLR